MTAAAAKRLGRLLIRSGVLVAPFVIFASLPLFHTGLWYKSEPVIMALHAISAFVAAGLGLAIVGDDRMVMRLSRHPLVLFPAGIALWGLLTAGMAAMPLVSWYGTPEFGQGIAWHLDIAILTVGGMVAVRDARTARWLAWSCGLAITALSATFLLNNGTSDLTPFISSDSLAFYGLFGTPLLLVLISPRRAVPIAATIAFGLLVIVISQNRTALALMIAAPFVIGGVWWLARTYAKAARITIALLTLMAPVVVTAAIAFSDVAAREASLWSRKLHLTVARDSLRDNPTDLIWGAGWGSYGERLLAYLPVGAFDLAPQENGVPEWDAAHSQIHFQSHNFLIEALLSGGLVAMGLAWAMMVALPLFCRRRHLVLAGSFAIVIASMFSVWAPDAGAIPLFALAMGGFAGPVAFSSTMKFFRPGLGAGILIAAVLLVATATMTMVTGTTMAREARDNRDTSASGKPALTDCRQMARDFGRGGVHLATLYRSFAVDLLEKRAAGALITETDAARLADYVCAVEHRIGDRASLRLANANLLVTAELASIRDDPALASIRSDRLSVWEARLRWYLGHAPTRSDMAVPYLIWAFANHRENSVAAIAALLLARDRRSPVGLWFSGIVMMANADTAAAGFDRMRQSLNAGIEHIMPIDPAIVDQISSRN